ncbi:hypothetical protein F6X40_17005 [Paraburkholderia sp. UCT31]|uniref:hypothetical protein n=1 Tax=Paraburkholderia sp. UCT31 TaxID=2615209 RepID=UPI0016556A3E|nr:hypothetical protein [Paraburkholderia sp. UCT31]MBC8738476.1 hypothetical protein [Paraburkholderia sp. UCT31]
MKRTLLCVALAGLAAHANAEKMDIAINTDARPTATVATAASTTGIGPASTAASPASYGAMVAPRATTDPRPAPAVSNVAPPHPTVQAPPPVAHPLVTPAATQTATLGAAPLPAPAGKPAQAAAPAKAVTTAASTASQVPSDAVLAKRVADNAAPQADDTNDGSDAKMNPFTGKSRQLETIQRRLELSKQTTALLQEDLKQATIEADIANLPIKKRAEIMQLPGAQQPAPAPVKPAPSPAPKKKRKAARGGKTQAKQPETVVVKEPTVALSSVIVNNGDGSAVLNIDGNTAVVANGESTPFGTLSIIDAQTVRVGSRMLRVHDETLSRVVVSDPKPVDPKALQSGYPGSLPAGVANPTAVRVPMSSLPPPPLPPTR